MVENGRVGGSIDADADVDVDAATGEIRGVVCDEKVRLRGRRCLHISLRRLRVRLERGGMVRQEEEAAEMRMRQGDWRCAIVVVVGVGWCLRASALVRLVIACLSPRPHVAAVAAMMTELGSASTGHRHRRLHPRECELCSSSRDIYAPAPGHTISQTSWTMEKQQAFPLPAARGEPNPLRPYSAYYREPSIGLPPSPSASPSQPGHAARSTPPRAGTSAAISSSARDLLPELDLDLRSSAGEAWNNTRSLFDALLYRYTSVLLAQPFDVAKTVLQVSLPPADPAVAGTTGTPQRRRSPRRRHQESGRGEQTDEAHESSDDDIPDYFSSAAPRSRSPRKRRRTPPSASQSPTPRPSNRRDAAMEYKLNLKRPDSLTHAISTLYNTSGAIGLWRATNCTFLHATLLRTTDSFIRSLLLALLGLPEIIGPEQSGLGSALGVTGSLGFSGLDLADSPHPFASLLVVGLSSCLTGLLLAPLDLVRTRLIITPASLPPRGLLQNLRRLPSLLAPSSLWLPTALAHTIPQLFSASTPLLLRRQLRITPETSPALWSLAAFSTCLTDLFLRLPLETLVRRAQLQHLTQTQAGLPVIVEPAPYQGVLGTLWAIVYAEGATRVKDPRTGMVRVRRGQGVKGLVRGWRVGFWGLVGVWGAGALGGGEGRGKGEF